MRMVPALLVCLALAASGAPEPQRRFQRGFRFAAARMATPDSFDGTFNFCRVMYDGAWSTDYPAADVNFSIRLSELTKTRVSRQPSGEPNHLIVRLTDDELFQCPILHMEQVENAYLTDEEAARLRTYLLKGGFLWVDDFWGSVGWDWFTGQLARALPPGEFPIKDLPLDHPLFRMMFEVKKLPQIPAIDFWRRTGGTSERYDDSAVPHFRGISDSAGRLMVLITHNTDISDAWEREGEDPQYFYSFSPDGYAVGINVLLYAMSH